MSIKKCVNGSFVNDVYREYGTDTDTITTLPKTIIGDGQPISAYTIKGNMSQSGTPTPSNPIYPQECGDLVTTGEHAGEYEIPILSNGVAYPVYLAEPIRKINDSVDTAPSSGTASRTIKKIVLDGTENISYNARNDDTQRWVVTIPTVGGTTTPDNVLSTHFVTVNSTAKPLSQGGICMRSTGNDVVIGGLYSDIGITSPSTSTIITASVKQFLADQYAAGTPVTVWYVLATATTESFTAPSVPTSGTAESFDVSTTLKPSEVSLTWHGWHEHEDTKFTTP